MSDPLLRGALELAFEMLCLGCTEVPFSTQLKDELREPVYLELHDVRFLVLRLPLQQKQLELLRKDLFRLQRGGVLRLRHSLTCGALGGLALSAA